MDFYHGKKQILADFINDTATYATYTLFYKQFKYIIVLSTNYQKSQFCLSNSMQSSCMIRTSWNYL